ncbi:ABC transporter permease [Paracoccus alkanivorans]|uniref:ABC transporter permease n=2 Tax=Paracoccus alkanivorans TaxID=2116655 RepID=A0A3M0MKB2_9RHOB|nr:ABC transporter permease [Paracoccus alkanivorans]
MRDDPVAVIGLVVLLVIVLCAIFADAIAPHDPTLQDYNAMLEAPSAQHLLGTDDLGRDVLSRLIHGATASIYASLLAVGVAALLGIPVGLIAGYTGGWVDEVISRILDTFLSFPAIVLAIAVTGVLGIGLTNAMLSVGIVFAPQLARLARARALVLKQELYVDAARCFGASTWLILKNHVLPNAIQPVLVQITLLMPVALLAEASLSFLGLGMQPPDSSWGSMIARAYVYAQIAPAQMYAPGIAILVTALAFNTVGESLREALDPTARR